MTAALAASGWSWQTQVLDASNIDAALAVVSDAAYRQDAGLITALASDGLTQLALSGDANGTYAAQNAAFDAWTTVVNGQAAAIIAFRGTDDIDYSQSGLTAFEQSADAGYWFDTQGYYELLADGVAAFDQAVAAAGISQVYATGHSLGGGAAQAYMAAHPDTARTGYDAVVFGSLGLSGTNGTPATDARVTAFVDSGDISNLLGTQTAGLTISFESGSSQSPSSGLDLSALIADPASLLTTHGIDVYADAANRYDAAKAGIPATDVTTFFTATAKVLGIDIVASPL